MRTKSKSNRNYTQNKKKKKFKKLERASKIQLPVSKKHRILSLSIMKGFPIG